MEEKIQFYALPYIYLYPKKSKIGLRKLNYFIFIGMWLFWTILEGFWKRFMAKGIKKQCFY